MRKIFRNQSKGITLIALVVTIVVLLILAGVSIQMLGGENGIIKKAQDAKQETIVAKEKESISLAKAAIKSRGEEVEQDNLQKELNIIEGEGKTKVSLKDDLSGVEIYFEDSKNTYEETIKEIEISEEEANNWTYEENEDGTINLLKYNGPSTELIVPNKLFGKRVKAVGSGNYCDNIWGDDISEKLLYGSAIVNIPITIKTIVIQNGIEKINKYAFLYGDKLKEIIIPNSVTSIGGRAFSGCSSLTSINIPESVTSIGNFAFYGCSSLTSINIPESVTSIGSGAFDGCSSLTTINLESTSIPSTWDSNWKGDCTATVNVGVSM